MRIVASCSRIGERAWLRGGSQADHVFLVGRDKSMKCGVLMELYGQGGNEVPKQSCTGPTISTTNPTWCDPEFEADDYRLRNSTTLGHKKT